MFHNRSAFMLSGEHLPFKNLAKPTRALDPNYAENIKAYHERRRVYDTVVHNLYSWVRDLPPDVELPDGDLLEDIHVYVSYWVEAHPKFRLLFLALDGTALVALGVLLEEMMREVLGEDGDLCLTEPWENDATFLDPGGAT